MKWNWQKKGWPKFNYDSKKLLCLESEFLHQAGVSLGSQRHLSEVESLNLLVEIISDEAIKTSEIEGEFLNRESVVSSIKRNFNLDTSTKKIPLAEQGISEMMHNLHQTYSEPFSHEHLHAWHSMLMKGRYDINDIGHYRTHAEPMQVVSSNLHNPKVHFEAPASRDVHDQMTIFINWVNQTHPSGALGLGALTRSGLAHLHFVCIHPFEDGNGRIGRAISEKILSQALGKPTLIALSHVIQKHRNDYYEALAANNKYLEVTDWLLYFAQTILEAQRYTQKLIDFLIEKTQLYDRIRGQLHERQEKVIARMFKEGLKGFTGGLSAENYISITQTSRATATRDLKHLVDIGALRKTGSLKSTRYYLALGV